ncbi:TRAP transporter small permease [Rhodovastum atsumiense]|uniref:TRAP transporter small permease protein n=1 Tax=Rhodovastum atsumiense TaxID=504468 RepID=A0A5M6IJT2_9PROT|nr:TRAP transporter small permease [Rhodovastum atsumiense]
MPSSKTPTTAVAPGFLSLYFGFHAVLARICLKISVLGLLVILAAVLIQIFGRYVLNDSPAWTEILALVLVLYVTCLAAAVGVRDGRHIGMESLLIYAPESVRKWAEIVVYAGMIVFGLAMSYGGSVLSFEMMEYLNPGLPISQAWSYVPLAVGGVLIALFAIERIVARLLNLEVVPSWH